MILLLLPMSLYRKLGWTCATDHSCLEMIVRARSETSGMPSFLHWLEDASVLDRAVPCRHGKYRLLDSPAICIHART